MAPLPIRGAALVLLTFALSLATFMNVLDTTITNVAIPAIAGNLAVSPNQATWVITSFSVSMAIALPLTGWLAKRYGEVRLFVGSVLLFTIASWLCGLAPNLSTLITFRVLQGAVAGPMIPLSQSLLLSNYPDRKKGMALAVWSMTTVVAPIFGPIFGGWLTDNVSWPWVFYINLPVGLISATLVWRLLGKRDTATIKLPIDKVGLGLLIIGVSTLQLMLDKGNELDWFESTQIVTLAAVAVMALTFFVAWELTEHHPIVDLTLFKRRNFAVGTIAIALGYMIFFGSVLILPLWLQTQMGYTATWAGLAAAPIGVLSLVFSPLVGRNLHNIDLRILVSIAFFVFAAVSFWSASFNTDVTYVQLALPRLLQGIGVACFFIPLVSILLSGLPPQRIASASGLSNFFRILGGSVGASLSVTLWGRRETLHQSQLVERAHDSNIPTIQALDQLQALGVDQAGTLARLDHIVSKQAYMLAINDFFLLAGVGFLFLLVFVWLARPPFFAVTPRQ